MRSAVDSRASRTRGSSTVEPSDLGKHHVRREEGRDQVVKQDRRRSSRIARRARPYAYEGAAAHRRRSRRTTPTRSRRFLSGGPVLAAKMSSIFSAASCSTSRTRWSASRAPRCASAPRTSSSRPGGCKGATHRRVGPRRRSMKEARRRRSPPTSPRSTKACRCPSRRRRRSRCHRPSSAPRCSRSFLARLG